MGDCEIRFRDNGPIVIEGVIVLKDAKGGVFDLSGRTQIALCRCGNSQNKPFCDGSHKKVNFQSEIVARQLPPPQPK